MNYTNYSQIPSYVHENTTVRIYKNDKRNKNYEFNRNDNKR